VLPIVSAGNGIDNALPVARLAGPLFASAADEFRHILTGLDQDPT